MPVDHSSVTLLARELGKVPLELRRQLRPKLKAGADHIVQDMRGRASWSSRIPQAIRTTVAFGGRRPGVTIKVNAGRAPHARPYERGNDGSRSSSFRHPVFGHDVWVSQATRPFFFPAVKAGRSQLQKQISDAVSASLRKVN